MSHSKRTSRRSYFGRMFKKLIFQSSYNGASIVDRIMTGKMKPEEWEWLTEDQIKHCDWRLLFQNIPTPAIPSLIRTIQSIDGDMGLSKWQAHLIYEFFDAHRGPEFRETGKERLLIAFGQLKPAHLPDLLGLLTEEEFGTIAPHLSGQEQVGMAARYFRSALADERLRGEALQQLKMLLRAMCQEERRPIAHLAETIHRHFDALLNVEQWADAWLYLLQAPDTQEKALALLHEQALRDLPHRMADALLLESLAALHKGDKKRASALIEKARDLCKALKQDEFVQLWLSSRRGA